MNSPREAYQDSAKGAGLGDTRDMDGGVKPVPTEESVAYGDSRGSFAAGPK
jgi:hypothetical protein